MCKPCVVSERGRWSFPRWRWTRLSSHCQDSLSSQAGSLPRRRCPGSRLCQPRPEMLPCSSDSHLYFLLSTQIWTKGAATILSNFVTVTSRQSPNLQQFYVGKLHFHTTGRVSCLVKQKRRLIPPDKGSYLEEWIFMFQLLFPCKRLRLARHRAVAEGRQRGDCWWLLSSTWMRCWLEQGFNQTWNVSS